METLVISDNMEIAAALTRALEVFGHKHLKKPMPATSRWRIPAGLAVETVLILYVTDELLLEQLIWGKIRKNYENPVIVLGFQKAEVFGKKQPAFNGVKEEKASYLSHGYTQIPLLLRALHELISRLEPVTDLVYVNNCYANEQDYLVHRVHFYPDTKLLRPDIVERLSEVSDYLRQIGEIQLAQKYDAEISLMPAKDWGNKAYGLRRMFEDFLTEKE